MLMYFFVVFLLFLLFCLRAKRSKCYKCALTERWPKTGVYASIVSVKKNVVVFCSSSSFFSLVYVYMSAQLLVSAYGEAWLCVSLHECFSQLCTCVCAVFGVNSTMRTCGMDVCVCVRVFSLSLFGRTLHITGRDMNTQHDHACYLCAQIYLIERPRLCEYVI